MDNLTTDPNKILDPFADKKLNKMIDSFWQKSENNFKILNESASVLARHAIRLTRTSMGANACVITLGAISATAVLSQPYTVKTIHWSSWPIQLLALRSRRLVD